MTPQQDKLFKFLLERVGDDVQPSIQEMADHLGVRGRASVHRLLQQLRDLGRVEKLPQAERCWRAVPVNPLKGYSLQQLEDELIGRGYVRDGRMLVPGLKVQVKERRLN